MQMKTQSRSHSYVGHTLQREWKKASNPLYPLPRLMYSSICMYTCIRIREEKFTRGRNRDIGRRTHRGEGEKESILRKNVKLHSSPQKTLPVAGARFFSQPDSPILQTVYFPTSTLPSAKHTIMSLYNVECLLLSLVFLRWLCVQLAWAILSTMMRIACV